MLHIFRRHLKSCTQFEKRTEGKCPTKPSCPIFFEGVDGQGKRHKQTKLIDPRTGNGIRDWARANEVMRDMETPAPVLVAEHRTPILIAIDHFLKTKESKSRDVYRKSRNLLKGPSPVDESLPPRKKSVRATPAVDFARFMAKSPLNYQFMQEIMFADITDFCSEWKDSVATNVRNLAVFCSFLKYCKRSGFTTEYLGDGLCRAMGWKDVNGPKEPFEDTELGEIWKVLPSLPGEYGRCGERISKQTEPFVYIMRYTGMDVSTTMKLPKRHVRGNKILTYRMKNGAEVWTIVPEWVIENLMAAPHDSEKYFFWSGNGKPHTRASKWFSRLRKLLDLAGLQHRTPHNFRHHFAIEHLLNGTPIEDVSRLLGHTDIATTIKSYGAWIEKRQKKLEGHQRAVWQNDPLHKKMTAPKPDSSEAA